MQTLIPQPVTVRARYLGRFGYALGYGLSARTLLLLIAGVLWAIPAFFHPHRVWMMLVWDGLIGLLVIVDLMSLPDPSAFEVTRRFLHSPALGERTEVEYEVVQRSNGIVTVLVTDDLHPALIATPKPLPVVAYPRDAVRTVLECYAGRRGDFKLGKIYLRYRGALRLVERWAVCDAEQNVRVFPASEQSGDKAAFYLMRARQIELQKRRLRLRGIGREFESLRDYQRGDELRNISWTATARRAKLITRQFTTACYGGRERAGGGGEAAVECDAVGPGDECGGDAGAGDWRVGRQVCFVELWASSATAVVAGEWAGSSAADDQSAVAG
jgi:hypothetical protein